MKILVAHLYQLDKIFEKLMIDVEFENFEDAVSIAESQEEFKSKMKVPNDLKSKIFKKYSDPKENKVSKDNIPAFNKELNELFTKEIEIENVKPISKTFLSKISITGLEASVLVKYGLIENKEPKPEPIE
jgi:hypothetical protein